MSDNDTVSLEDLLAELGPDGPRVIQTLVSCGSIVGKCLHECGGANVSMNLEVQFTSGERKRVIMQIGVEDIYDA
jgi:hypothetical protein